MHRDASIVLRGCSNGIERVVAKIEGEIRPVRGDAPAERSSRRAALVECGLRCIDAQRLIVAARARLSAAGQGGPGGAVEAVLQRMAGV